MNTSDQIRPQRGMDSTMAGNSAHWAEGLGADQDIEMRLSPVAPTAMATVAFAVIFDPQLAGGKGFAKSVLNLITNAHFAAVPSSM